MLMWVKSDDAFGQSLLRTVKRFLLICFIVGFWVGIASATWLTTAWIAIKIAITPVIRIH